MRYFYLAALLISALVAPAGAITLTPEQEIIEVALEAQGANVSYIARAFGIDAGNTLAFDATLDPLAQTYSFDLAPGSTYLGESLSLSGSGSFGAGLWSSSVSGALGVQNFAGSGTASFTPDDPDVDSTRSQVDWVWGSFDYHSTTDYVHFVDSILSLGRIEFTHNGDVVATAGGSDSIPRNGAGPVTWTIFEPRPNPEVVPPIDGSGIIDIEIVALSLTSDFTIGPEPSTGLLLALGLVGMAAKRRRAASGISSSIRRRYSK